MKLLKFPARNSNTASRKQGAPVPAEVCDELFRSEQFRRIQGAAVVAVTLAAAAFVFAVLTFVNVLELRAESRRSLVPLQNLATEFRTGEPSAGVVATVEGQVPSAFGPPVDLQQSHAAFAPGGWRR